MLQVVPFLRVREQELIEDLPGGSLARPLCNTRSDLIVSKGLPTYAECSRTSCGFAVVQAAAVAPVAAVPTTTAAVAIWNGEPDGGRSYVLDSVFCIVVTSAAAAKNWAVVGQLNLGRKAAISGTAITPKAMNGLAYWGKASVRLAVSVTNDAAWQPLGNSFVFDTAGASIGATFHTDIDGRIIIPPGHVFGMSTLCTAVASTTCKLGFRWYEVNLPIGPGNR